MAFVLFRLSCDEITWKEPEPFSEPKSPKVGPARVDSFLVDSAPSFLAKKFSL